MPVGPTLFPWVRQTAKLLCSAYVDDMLQPDGITFPPLKVRWYPRFVSPCVWVDAGRAAGPPADQPWVYLDFPREPAEWEDDDTMLVLAVPCTGKVRFLGQVYGVTGLELPECRAHRSASDRRVFVVDAVTLRGSF